MGVLDDIVREIECDESLANSTVTITLADSSQGTKSVATPITKKQILQWASSMQTQLLDRHYRNYDINQLKTIIIGSFGIPGYNSKIALAAEPGIFLKAVPDEIHKFIEYLNKSLSRPSCENYDYYCQQSKPHTLFVNLCNQTNDNSEWISAICTIRFVNSILKFAKQQNQQLAILDFRRSKHIHRDDLSVVPKFLKLAKIQHSQIEKDGQVCHAFKMDYAENEHYLMRVGKSSLPKWDLNFGSSALVELRQKGFEIDQLFISRKTGLQSTPQNDLEPGK